MFNNIGKKLQILAIISFILGFIASIVIGIYYLFQLDSILPGILIIVFGPLGSWIGSWSIYALGFIAENSENQQEDLILIKTKLRSLESKPANKVTPPTTTPNTPTNVVSTVQQKKTFTPNTPTNVVSTVQQKKTLPTLSEQGKEATYHYAMEMYKQQHYGIALKEFKKVLGYKDADKYIAELQK